MNRITIHLLSILAFGGCLFWASGATAQIPNYGFESGDLTGWTATGDAFEIGGRGDISYHPMSGRYFVKSSTFNPDEGIIESTRTGTLRSSTFILDDNSIRFQAHAFVDEGGVLDCAIYLRRATDNSELAALTQFAPAFPKTEIITTDDANIGEEVYLELVDNSSTAYLVADNFRIVHAPSVITNGGFETGDYTGWTKTGAAFDPNPYSNAREGNYFVQSYPPVTTTGSIRSEDFVLTKGAITFYSTMYLSAYKDAWVALKRTSDGMELDRATNMSWSGWGQYVLHGPIGETVYIEVVDQTTTSIAVADGFYEIPSSGFQNCSFEYATWENWTVTGTGWGAAPQINLDPNLPFIADIGGSMAANGTNCAHTYGPGPTAAIEGTGTIRSGDFELTGNRIEFYIAGIEDADCFVALRNAENDSLIDQITVPANVVSTWLQVRLEANHLEGTVVYLECVDNSVDGWMAVDDFIMTKAILPPNGVVDWALY